VEEELDRRRHFCELLRELTAADPSLAPQVLDAMAGHGIHPGGSNDELRTDAGIRPRRRQPDDPPS
jgi:hypothetical protein